MQLDFDVVIKGLKKFKSIAKQEVLVNSSCGAPEELVRAAQARKDTYEELIELVNAKGVGGAFDEAVEEYRRLSEDEPPTPEVKGRVQAIWHFIHDLYGYNNEDEDLSKCERSFAFERIESTDTECYA